MSYVKSSIVKNNVTGNQWMLVKEHPGGWFARCVGLGQNPGTVEYGQELWIAQKGLDLNYTLVGASYAPQPEPKPARDPLLMCVANRTKDGSLIADFEQYNVGDVAITKGRWSARGTSLQQIPKTIPTVPVEGSVWVNDAGRRVRVVNTTRGVVQYQHADNPSVNGFFHLDSFYRWYKYAGDFADLGRRVIGAPYGKGLDLHKLRAAEIFDVKPSEVTAAQRRVGKQANFLDMYK